MWDETSVCKESQLSRPVRSRQKPVIVYPDGEPSISDTPRTVSEFSLYLEYKSNNSDRNIKTQHAATRTQRLGLTKYSYLYSYTFLKPPIDL